MRNKFMAVMVTGVVAVGLALVGPLGASATDHTVDHTFETNRTVSVPANGTMTFVKSCMDSKSHPEGGVLVGGYVSYNEQKSQDAFDAGELIVVSEQPTAEGWETVVENKTDKPLAYLSWAKCQYTAPVVNPPATITLFWELPEGKTGDSPRNEIWPQTFLGTNADKLQCGYYAQWDTYRYTTDEEKVAVDNLWADGILSAGPEDSGKHAKGVTPWGFVYGGDCAVTPPTTVPPVVTPPTTTVPPVEELAYTGATTDGLIPFAFGSLLLGAGLLFMRRKVRA